MIKIVSGGQTGVDRAALDVAIELNIPYGGWCPQGRRAELGQTIPSKYQLKETSSSDFSVRTRRNIQDSDGTLILVPEIPIKVSDGTLLTVEEVRERRKHYLVLSLSEEINIQEIIDWVNNNEIQILNVAGPRESQSPGIYQASFSFLRKLMAVILLEEEKRNSNSFRFK